MKGLPMIPFIARFSASPRGCIYGDLSPRWLAYVNGNRPGPARRYFAIMGIGAAEFCIRDAKGRYQFVPGKRGQIRTGWRFGLMTFKPNMDYDKPDTGGFIYFQAPQLT